MNAQVQEQAACSARRLTLLLSWTTAEQWMEGIAVTTMGVGNGFYEDLMEHIAENGGGNFYYIAHAEDIPGIFSQELQLQGLLQIVAQNLQLKLTPQEGVKVTGVYGYKAKQTEGSIDVSLNDIYRNENKSILIELAIPPRTSGENPLLEWTYVNVTQGVALSSVKLGIRGHFTDNMDLLRQPPDAKMEKQIYITESAKVNEHVIQAFDSGNMEQGRELLEQQAEKMFAFAVESDDSEIREDSQVLYQQLQNFTYDAQKRKEFHVQKYQTMKRKKM